MPRTIFHTALMIIGFIGLSLRGHADDAPPQTLPPVNESPAFFERLFRIHERPVEIPPIVPGRKHLVIVCGLTGGEEFRQRFTQTTLTLIDALTTRGGFDNQLVQLYLGDAAMQDVPELRSYLKGDADRESLKSLAMSLTESVKPADTLWMIVLGHSHFDGRRVWLNLPERDVDEQEFGMWFEGVGGTETTFWITVPASGFFVGPLSRPGRIIVTATEADREIVATEFPHMLADVLSNPPPEEQRDPDGDGSLSLLDLYLMTTRRVAESFRERELWATEHAHLDDNGDRRGSEVQRTYLPEDLDGRLAEGEEPRPRTGDREGAFAAQILLPRDLLLPAAPAEEPTPSEAAESVSSSDGDASGVE